MNNEIIIPDGHSRRDFFRRAGTAALIATLPAAAVAIVTKQAQATEPEVDLTQIKPKEARDIQIGDAVVCTNAEHNQKRNPNRRMVNGDLRKDCAYMVQGFSKCGGLLIVGKPVLKKDGTQIGWRKERFQLA
jgi:hypothetical protein